MRAVDNAPNSEGCWTCRTSKVAPSSPTRAVEPATTPRGESGMQRCYSTITACANFWVPQILRHLSTINATPVLSRFDFLGLTAEPQCQDDDVSSSHRHCPRPNHVQWLGKVHFFQSFVSSGLVPFITSPVEPFVCHERDVEPAYRGYSALQCSACTIIGIVPTSHVEEPHQQQLLDMALHV